VSLRSGTTNQFTAEQPFDKHASLSLEPNLDIETNTEGKSHLERRTGRGGAKASSSSSRPKVRSQAEKDSLRIIEEKAKAGQKRVTDANGKDVRTPFGQEVTNARNEITRAKSDVTKKFIASNFPDRNQPAENTGPNLGPGKNTGGK
jgi:hypothetical protein